MCGIFSLVLRWAQTDEDMPAGTVAGRRESVVSVLEGHDVRGMYVPRIHGLK